MKKLLIVFSLFTFSLSAVTLTVDKVEQRHPWNGVVDIEYTIAQIHSTASDSSAPSDRQEVLQLP